MITKALKFIIVFAALFIIASGYVIAQTTPSIGGPSTAVEPIQVSGEVFTPPAPQINTINNLIIPADGNEPPRIEDASGKIAIEGKIIQLEQKINQLIYLNAILLLFIVVPALSLGIVKIRKKLLSTIEVEPR